VLEVRECLRKKKPFYYQLKNMKNTSCCVTDKFLIQIEGLRYHIVNMFTRLNLCGHHCS
jgi:hypothetical protein